MSPQNPTKTPPVEDRDVTLDEFDELVRQKHGIPQGLWKGMAAQESGGDWNAKSPTGVKGKYQVTKATAAQYGLNRDDPWDQTVAAAKHLRAQYDALGNIKNEKERWLGAVGRYYAGGDAVKSDGTLSNASPDGVSNPAAHVDRVARNWAALERGSQPAQAAQPQQPKLEAGKSNTPRPAQQQAPAKPLGPRISAMPGTDIRRPMTRQIQNLSASPLETLQQGMAQRERMLPETPELQAKRKAAEEYAQRSIPGQIYQTAKTIPGRTLTAAGQLGQRLETIGQGLAHGDVTPLTATGAQLAGGLVTGVQDVAGNVSNYLQPPGVAPNPAAREAIQQQLGRFSYANAEAVKENAKRAYESAARKYLTDPNALSYDEMQALRAGQEDEARTQQTMAGNVTRAVGDALPAVAMGAAGGLRAALGTQAVMGDVDRPLDTAVNMASTAVPMALTRAARPMLNNATQAMRPIPRAVTRTAGEMGVGAAGNVGQSLVTQPLLTGKIDPGKLVEDAAVGAAFGVSDAAQQGLANRAARRAQAPAAESAPVVPDATAPPAEPVALRTSGLRAAYGETRKPVVEQSVARNGRRSDLSEPIPDLPMKDEPTFTEPRPVEPAFGERVVTPEDLQQLRAQKSYAPIELDENGQAIVAPAKPRGRQQAPAPAKPQQPTVERQPLRQETPAAPETPTAPVQEAPQQRRGRLVNVNGQDFELTPEQEARWQREVDEPLAGQMERAAAWERQGDKATADKIRRGAAMRIAAVKRDIVGSHTGRELQKQQAREASNYRDKPVSVDINGEKLNGKVSGNAFGRLKVTLDDGRNVTVNPDQVGEPVAVQKPVNSPEPQNPTGLTRRGVPPAQPLRPNIRPATVERMPRRSYTEYEGGEVRDYYKMPEVGEYGAKPEPQQPPADILPFRKRPPAPEAPRRPLQLRGPADKSITFPKEQRSLVGQGRIIEESRATGTEGQGAYGRFAQQAFKSTIPDGEKGQTSFYESPNVKGALGLDADASANDTRQAFKKTFARMMKVNADEVSLTQVPQWVWDAWMRRNSPRLGAEDKRRYQQTIQNAQNIEIARAINENIQASDTQEPSSRAGSVQPDESQPGRVSPRAPEVGNGATSPDADFIHGLIPEGSAITRDSLIRESGLTRGRLNPALESLKQQGRIVEEGNTLRRAGEVRAEEAKTVESSQSEATQPAQPKGEGSVASAPRVDPAKVGVAKHLDLFERVEKGEATAAEFKAAFEDLVANKDAIKAELSKLTKEGIFEKFPNLRWRYKNDTKADIVDAAYREMQSDYTLDQSFSYGLSDGSYAKGIRTVVDKFTDESLSKYAEKVKQAEAERAEKRKAAQEGMEDPQTLEDFNRVIRAKATEIGEGATFQQVRMALTPEQRARYDELAGSKSRDERRARADQQRTEVRAASQSMTGDVIETKHTKTGESLFVVKAAERVERDVYNQWNETAKRLGGWYSSFRGAGAVPGFQFKTRANADAFLEYLGGNVEKAKEVVQTRRDAMQDDKSQTAVERLREMADALDERATESLAMERKQNTERRARFAANAEATANSSKAMAKTMRNIAEAIESGKAKFLDRVRQKVQVEMLQSFVHSGQGDYLRSKYPTYAEQEKHFGEPPTKEAADHATFPAYTSYRSDLAKLGRQLSEQEGTKKIGAAIMRVADDVTDAYLKFAKENIHKVSTFSRKDGERAVFASKATAEAAIARSGYKGQAIVLPFKRGQNIIILSPSAARERGIWEGDNDKRITLSNEIGDELVEKLKTLKRRDIDVPWTFEAAYDKRKRLAGMGIETPAELRAALREFIGLREQAKAPDKIKEMERAMIGRKNDGLDFFPTPASVADRMIEVADVKEGMAVLEPSAGMGHIADRLRETGVNPDVVEMANDRRELLKAKGYTLVGSDFTDLKPRTFYTYGDTFRHKDGTVGVMRGSGGMGSGRVGFIPEGETERTSRWVDRDDLTGIRHNGSNSGYDRIIMNPPFSNRRDIEHVRHAYDLLKPEGRLVAIMGEGSFFGSDKKATEFREWLESVGGTSEKLEEGSFLDPSLPVNTGVNARLVVIDKAADAKPVERSVTVADSAPVPALAQPQPVAEQVAPQVKTVDAKPAQAESPFERTTPAKDTPEREKFEERASSTASRLAEIEKSLNRTRNQKSKDALVAERTALRTELGVQLDKFGNPKGIDRRYLANLEDVISEGDAVQRAAALAKLAEVQKSPNAQELSQAAYEQAKKAVTEEMIAAGMSKDDAQTEALDVVSRLMAQPAGRYEKSWKENAKFKAQQHAIQAEHRKEFDRIANELDASLKELKHLSKEQRQKFADRFQKGSAPTAATHAVESTRDRILADAQAENEASDPQRLVKATRSLQPFEEVRVKPSQAWGGRQTEAGGEYITDGHMIVKRSLLKSAKEFDTRFLENPRSQELVQRLWDSTVAEAGKKEPADIVGTFAFESKGKPIDVAVLLGRETDQEVHFNAQFLAFLKKHTKFDEIRVSGDKAAVLLHSGKPVAVVMPQRKGDFEIDVPTARQMLAEKKSTPDLRSSGLNIAQAYRELSAWAERRRLPDDATHDRYIEKVGKTLKQYVKAAEKQGIDLDEDALLTRFERFETQLDAARKAKDGIAYRKVQQQIAQTFSGREQAKVTRDADARDTLRSPLSNLNYIGTYEKLGGKAGKAISEAFKDAQVELARNPRDRNATLDNLVKTVKPYQQELRLAGKPQLANYIDAHLDAVRGGNEPFTGLANFLTKFNYYRILAYNPRSAAVNWLQPFQTLWPHLTTREFAKVMTDARKPEVRARLKEIAEKESGGQVEGMEKRRVRDLFGTVSDSNRIVGHLAGELMADKLGLTGHEKARMAADWAQKVEFDNGRFGAPPLFRQPIARVLLQFKGYTAKNLERLHADWTSAPLPELATNKWRGAGTIARHSKMIASQVAIGGVRSVTGISSIGGVLILGSLAKALSKQMPEEDANKLAESIYFGAPALLEQDLSSSMMLLDAPFGKTPSEKIVNSLGGPTLGLMVKLWLEGQNYSDAKTDEKANAALYRAAKATTPYVKTIETATALAQGRRPVMQLGKQKVEMTPLETAGYGLMGTPLRQTRFYEEQERKAAEKKARRPQMPRASQ